MDQQNARADIAPDWALWLDLLAVNVSQAAALSLNLDPARTDKVPSLALRQELQRRALVIQNHAENRGFRVTGRDFDRRAKTRQPRLPLADFVLWALARSWAIPESLARRFAPSPGPIQSKETPAMLQAKNLVVPYTPGGIYSLSAWADHLAQAELPKPEATPTSADAHCIEAIYAWRPSNEAKGVYRLTPKPGATWWTLDDVRVWDECFISDARELAQHDIDGYLDQALNYQGPWLIVLSGGMVPLRRPVLIANEWDSYREQLSACAHLRWTWWFTLWEAVKASRFPCFNEAARRVERPSDITTQTVYVRLQDLAAWLHQDQPLLTLSMADPAPIDQAPPAVTAPDAASPITAPAAASHHNSPASTAATVADAPINSKGMSAWKTLLLERRDEVLKVQDAGGVVSVVRWIVREGEHIGIERSAEPGSEISYRDGNNTVTHVGRDAISNALSALRKGRLGPKRNSESGSSLTA